MKLIGLDFSEIDCDTIPKWDYGTVKEKGKRSVRFIWLDSYVRDFKANEYRCESHLLEQSSRGTLTLDGKRLVEKSDIDEGTRIFNLPIFGK